MILSTRYRNLGLSRQALHAFGKSPMRFPGKFVPAVPAVIAINILADSGADIDAGDTLILQTSAATTETLTVIKVGEPTANELLIPDSHTPAQIYAAIVNAIEANTELADGFECADGTPVAPAHNQLLLKNSYNDPLGFNLPGATGAILPTGTAVDDGKLSVAIASPGKNFVPGYLFVPMRGGRWVPAINYPASLIPEAP